MSLAFNPEDGRPPRLLRFVDPSGVPSSDTLAIYDKPNNLVIINKQLYDQLTPVQKHTTQRTQTSLVMH
jgi:hypothetical protein